MCPSRKSSIRRQLLLVQSLLGMVAALMMFLGQSLAAGAAPGSDTAWAETCSGADISPVRIEGEATLEECAHCDFCAVRISAVSAGASPPACNGSKRDFTSVAFFDAGINSAPGAEQYWAAKRGPPLKSEDNMNMNTALRAAMTTRAQGGVSWL